MIDFFYLGLAFILMHEMDAIRCREWRIFPGLSLIKNQRLAFGLFLFLHIPLFYWIVLETWSQDLEFRKGFDYFLIIHLFLHLLFLMHKNNEFKDWISWVLITGAAFFGLADLLVIGF